MIVVGYLTIPGLLSEDEVESLAAAIDALEDEAACARGAIAALDKPHRPI